MLVPSPPELRRVPAVPPCALPGSPVPAGPPVRSRLPQRSIPDGAGGQSLAQRCSELLPPLLFYLSVLWPWPFPQPPILKRSRGVQQAKLGQRGGQEEGGGPWSLCN